VHEALELEIGFGLVESGHFGEARLAREHNARSSELARLTRSVDALRRSLGRCMYRDAWMPLFDKAGEAPVLHEDGVGRESAEEGEELGRRGELALQDYRIERGVKPDSLFMGESMKAAVFEPVEVLGLFAGGKIGKAEVESIRAAFYRRYGGIEPPRGEEELWQSFDEWHV
jgi:hypothetical protein